MPLQSTVSGARTANFPTANTFAKQGPAVRGLAPFDAALQQLCQFSSCKRLAQAGLKSVGGRIGHALGFSNAVVKLVFSKANGFQQLHRDTSSTTLNADMYSVRLRFAYYY
ncbi:MAG: hypothetical protein WCG85_16100 [Polyangia bacterium]